MSKAPEYNWEAIETEYCAGLTPIPEICARYNVSRSRLTAMAAKMKWVRIQVDPQVINGAASIISSPKSGTEYMFDEDELKRFAVITGATITNLHRKDVARLRGVASLLIDRLGHVLEGRSPGYVEIDGKNVELPCLGARESPADLLEKLSRVTVRYVEIERVCYGLDVPGNDPDKDSENVESESMVELRGMVDRLETIATNKAMLADATMAPQIEPDAKPPKEVKP